MKFKKILSFMITMGILISPLVSNQQDVYADSVKARNIVVGNGNVIVFSDISANHWAKDQIYSFVNQGIVDGYKDGTFKPSNGVTREEFCKLLVSTFKPALNTPDKASFSDVTGDRWSYSHIEACKEFLTGYANPLGGLPTFHPAEYAKREDIAVALVKMIGLTPKGDNYLYEKFYDSGEISPALQPYVSLAVGKGLISGYPDGSFKPKKGISRAETVALLDRATKQAVADINKDLKLSATVAYNEQGDEATVNVSTEEDAVVTVDGKTLEMDSWQYGGTFKYKFEKEGSKNFVIEAKKAGKTKKITVTAKYEIGAPVLNIEYCPENVATNSIEIKGRVKSDYSPVLTINGEQVSIDWISRFNKTVNLKEGANKFEFVLKNSYGKTVKQTKTVNFTPGGPELYIEYCPENVATNSIEIKGRVKGDYSPVLTINGEQVSIDWISRFNETVNLKEGENKFEFVLKNRYGKETRQTRIINFSVGNPKIVFVNCPESTTKSNLRITGRIEGVNAGALLFMNDEEKRLDYDKEFSINVELEKGDNTFKFRAVNDYGKEVTVEKTVRYE